jgi:hypothetical protein
MVLSLGRSLLKRYCILVVVGVVVVVVVFIVVASLSLSSSFFPVAIVFRFLSLFLSYLQAAIVRGLH